MIVLPEIGGKIWTAIEKSTGKPFLYDNHVVKFRDIAMRGPWTSGGIEANYGIIGHTPNCATPVDYLTRQNPDGSASVVIGALDLLTRTPWRLEITLPADKAYFTTRSLWQNTSALEQPYYTWMNAGLKAAGNLAVRLPGHALPRPRRRGEPVADRPEDGPGPRLLRAERLRPLQVVPRLRRAVGLLGRLLPRRRLRHGALLARATRSSARRSGSGACRARG